jgi:hypothetical protein
MTRFALTIFLVATPPLAHARERFDLLALKACSPKGRFQDLAYNPSRKQAERLVGMGTELIPFLISRLESTRRYREPPVCLWPEMVEGDMALLILMDLFLDPTWAQTSLPESCWSGLRDSDTARDAPAYEVLSTYVKRMGRKAIHRRWEDLWSRHRTRIKWDAAGRFFRISGIDLSACSTL